MKRSGAMVRLGLVVGLAASLLAGAAPASVRAATPAASGLGKEVRLTTNQAEQMWPEVSGRKVAYSDYRHYREVGDPNDPEILYDIRVRDVKTGKDRLLTPKHTAMGDAAISGNRVVWIDYGNGRTTGGIWYHNLATGTHKRVPVKGGQEVAISGTRLCYERSNRIYTYDLATKKERAVSPKGGIAGACDISGKVVVWQDFRNGNLDIYAYDLGKKKERRLTTDANSQGLPKVSGKVVVWHDDRNGGLNSDIYAYDLGTKQERPVATAPGTQGSRTSPATGSSGWTSATATTTPRSTPSTCAPAPRPASPKRTAGAATRPSPAPGSSTRTTAPARSTSTCAR